MKENGTDSITALKNALNEHYDALIVDELALEDMVQLSEDSKTIVFTEKGTYTNCKSDQQLHKIDNLCIRPGVTLTLHQRYPSYVTECEGSNIAMDEQIASNIRVWREPQHITPAIKEVSSKPKSKKFDRRTFRSTKKGS